MSTESDVPVGYDPRWWAGHVARMARLSRRAKFSDPAVRRQAFRELRLRAWEPPPWDPVIEQALSEMVTADSVLRLEAAQSARRSRTAGGSLGIAHAEVFAAQDRSLMAALARSRRNQLRRERAAARRSEIGAALVARFGGLREVDFG